MAEERDKSPRGDSPNTPLKRVGATRKGDTISHSTKRNPWAPQPRSSDDKLPPRSELRHPACSLRHRNLRMTSTVKIGYYQYQV